MKFRLVYVVVAMLFWLTATVSAQDTSLKVSAGTYVSQSQADRDIYGDGWNLNVSREINKSDMAPLSISLGYIKQDTATTDKMQIPLILKTTISEGSTYISVGAGTVFSESKIAGNVQESSFKFGYQAAFGLKCRSMFFEAGYLGGAKAGGYTLSVGSIF